jgi:hypothetical protein
MKKLLLTVACVGFASVSAFAGTCPGGGCGDKKGDKKETPKQTCAPCEVCS